MFASRDKATARRLAAEWARRYYADAVSDLGRVADAEKFIRSSPAKQEESATQFLTTNKGQFSASVDRDDLWAYFWPAASSALKKRLSRGVGAPRRNPDAPVPIPRRGRAAGSEGLTGTLNVNTATFQQFQLLPGIGPKVARQIVRLRERGGGKIAAVDLLPVEIDGIGETIFARIRPHLALDGSTTLSLRLRAPTPPDPEPASAERPNPSASSTQRRRRRTAGDGTTMRLRFETDFGLTVKEIEVSCDSSDPEKSRQCAISSIQKHIADPALRSVVRVVTHDTNGHVLFAMKVSHCKECEKDGLPKLSDVAVAEIARTKDGRYVLERLRLANGKDVSTIFRTLDVWSPMSDVQSLTTTIRLLFKKATIRALDRA